MLMPTLACLDRALSPFDDSPIVLPAYDRGETLSLSRNTLPSRTLGHSEHDRVESEVGHK